MEQTLPWVSRGCFPIVILKLLLGIMTEWTYGTVDKGSFHPSVMLSWWFPNLVILLSATRTISKANLFFRRSSSFATRSRIPLSEARISSVRGERATPSTTEKVIHHISEEWALHQSVCQQPSRPIRLCLALYIPCQISALHRFNSKYMTTLTAPSSTEIQAWQ